MARDCLVSPSCSHGETMSALEAAVASPIQIGKSCLVVIPAFNEEATITAVVEGVRAHLRGADVVVVDDGSQDATGQRARAAGASVIRHASNLGYGGAVQTGLRYGKDGMYSFVAILDADEQHDPADLPRLFEPLVRGEV